MFDLTFISVFCFVNVHNASENPAVIFLDRIYRLSRKIYIKINVKISSVYNSAVYNRRDPLQRLECCNTIVRLCFGFGGRFVHRTETSGYMKYGDIWIQRTLSTQTPFYMHLF